MNATTLKNWLRLCGTLGLLASLGGCNAMFLDAEVDTDTSGGDADTDSDSDTDSDTDVDTESDVDTGVTVCDGSTDCRGSCAPCAISEGGDCYSQALACYGDEYCISYATCVQDCIFGAPAELDTSLDSALVEPNLCLDECILNAQGDALVLYYEMEFCTVCIACTSDCMYEPIAAECGGVVTDACESNSGGDCATCRSCAVTEGACAGAYNDCLNDTFNCAPLSGCIDNCNYGIMPDTDTGMGVDTVGSDTSGGTDSAGTDTSGGTDTGTDPVIDTDTGMDTDTSGIDTGVFFDFNVCYDTCSGLYPDSSGLYYTLNSCVACDSCRTSCSDPDIACEGGVIPAF